MDVTPGYYDFERREVTAFLPENAERILEVGCGTGATLAYLKSAGLCRWVGGVEPAHAPGAIARRHLDGFWAIDIESELPTIGLGSLDAVLCLDVLEHLRDPWSAVRRLAPLLRPGGVLIASIPNLRYYKVVLPLLLRGEFRYAEGGILDRTHLRFFVERTARELIQQGGLVVDRVEPLGLKPRTAKWFLNALSGRRLTGLYARQYLLRGVRLDPAAASSDRSQSMHRRFQHPRLVIASHNGGKVREIADLLQAFAVEVVAAGALGLPVPEETGDSFAANARLKALAAAKATGLPALADDSGLCAEAIGGEPGIFTADWAGPERDFAMAMRRLEQALAGKTDRRAHFVSALALAWPDGHVETFEGEVHGQLVWPPRGEKGFGYDPMFVPEGETLTYGEVDQGWKHRTSHRGRAFERLVDGCFGGCFGPAPP
ncbi:MAG: RdgB/HAM1 family non-canonical purine NTP pyrophosphatase [Proteobacteria bacterium]|nr:RdgB/HAM1 family non-canonical purine NTP pyrophosphatase [Pseudomonadota bacterium]MBI3498740.1 RdgB/HAM1 family non-canonical purine NTP pyrophosphatase [Pseudomonadota bacterium]